MIVPFGDLAKQYKMIKKVIDKAAGRVLASGWFILGREVQEFERSFAHYIGVKHCVGVGNGHDALRIALQAAGVKRGDEVITTPVSAAATALAIINVGAVPVFADVDPATLLLDPDKIPAAVTRKTAAIFPVHLYGQMCDMKKIMALARRHRLKVVEDCAQAAGAQQGGKPAGSFGDFGAFSFYPSKNLGAFGDAGAVTTNHASFARMARALSDYGQVGRYNHVYAGLNSRLDELQAAILSAKLARLTAWNRRRRQIAQFYTRQLANLPIELPQANTKADDSSHVFHLYVIKTGYRDRLQTYLAKKGVSTQVHYPKVLYQQPALKRFFKGRCMHAEQAVREIISLPIYPELKDAQVNYVCRQIQNFYKQQQ